jgi:hypothetical protein
MFVEDKVLYGLAISFNKVFFELIDIFTNIKPCFNPSHSRDFMNPNDVVYHVVFFHDFSPCENLGFNEKLNCEEVMGEMHHPLLLVV